jgi:hypothetical protein
MSTGVAIAIMLIVFAIFGILGVVVAMQIKKTDPSNVDASLKSNASTTQEMLPFEDIKDSIIHLGDFKYRAVIQVSSLNYNLKTEKEQDVIELSYQRFLNSLSHPIQIAIYTKTMDNTKMLESLKADILDTIDVFPILQDYGEYYYNEMVHIYDNIGNNKEKKKYIIVPYDEAVELTNSTDAEKYDYAWNELQNRCLIIRDGLQGLGLQVEILDSSQIIDLLYSVYHKDEANQSENISSGDFLSLLVDGDDKLMSLSHEARLDWILYETQKRLEMELSTDKAVDNEMKAKANLAIQKITELRNDIAGYYKFDSTKDLEVLYYEED